MTFNRPIVLVCVCAFFFLETAAVPPSTTSGPLIETTSGSLRETTASGFLSQTTTSGPFNQTTTPAPVPKKPPTEVTVELLIVCDKEFYALFQHDEQRIIDYWATQIWDVNMRFKSLRILDISVRVTNLLVVSKQRHQRFIENARGNNGSIYLQSALINFSKWVASRSFLLKKFDIAILATGAAKMEKYITYWPYDLGTVCMGNPTDSFSTLLVHFESPWGNICSAVTQGLAHLMGAPMDTHMDFSTGCKDKGYLRTKDECGKNQYFFSKCSEALMAKQINNPTARCLHRIDEPNEDILAKYATNMTHPPSLEEQCFLVTGNRDVVLVNEEDKCVRTKCLFRDMAVAREIYPLENSPCGSNKFCFRGRCLQQGFRLVNAGIEREISFHQYCLHSGDRFSSIDYPTMDKCVNAPTPLDQIMVLDNGSSELFLVTPYASRDASENEDKCISIDMDDEYLQYSKCSTEDKKWLTWNFIGLNDTNNEFLMYHPFTNTCATIDVIGDVKPNKTCDENDERQRWKFHDNFAAPRSWFKSLATISGKTNFNTEIYTAVDPFPSLESSDDIIKENAVTTTESWYENNSELLGSRTRILTFLVGLFGTLVGIMVFFCGVTFLRRKVSSDKIANPEDGLKPKLSVGPNSVSKLVP